MASLVFQFSAAKGELMSVLYHVSVSSGSTTGVALPMLQKPIAAHTSPLTIGKSCAQAAKTKGTSRQHLMTHLMLTVPDV